MSLVRLERRGGVAHLLLDSPANRNALSARLHSELYRAPRQASAEDDVRSIVLGHTGTVFCSGANLKEARDAPAAPRHRRATYRCGFCVVARRTVRSEGNSTLPVGAAPDTAG